MTSTNRPRDDEPITEKAPNSVLTQRDLDAIARDGDHVWQSNRPESSSGKSLRAKADAFRSLRARQGCPERKKLCRRLFLRSWPQKPPRPRWESNGFMS